MRILWHEHNKGSRDTLMGQNERTEHTTGPETIRELMGTTWWNLCSQLGFMRNSASNCHWENATALAGTTQGHVQTCRGNSQKHQFLPPQNAILPHPSTQQIVTISVISPPFAPFALSALSWSKVYFLNILYFACSQKHGCNQYAIGLIILIKELHCSESKGKNIM